MMPSVVDFMLCSFYYLLETVFLDSLASFIGANLLLQEVQWFSRQTYLAKANRQLTDEHFHKKMDSDPTKEFSVLIIQTLDKIYNNDETTVIL